MSGQRDPLPLLYPRFWTLVFKTARMKFQFRASKEDRRYTDFLKRFYNRAETPHVETYGDAFDSIRAFICDLAQLEPGDTVLDVATGGGYQAAAFSQRGHRTVGIDYVHDRALLAREQQGNHALHWCAGDAAHLPFASNSFDVITISLALHDMLEDDITQVLAEFRRIARRKVIIIEPKAPDSRLLMPLFKLVAEVLDESPNIVTFLDYDLKPMIRHAGLHLVKWRRCYNGILAVYVCDSLT
jgi:SAM-dependent methyltransferase